MFRSLDDNCLVDRARDFHMETRVKLASGQTPTHALSEFIDISKVEQSYKKICDKECNHSVDKCIILSNSICAQANTVLRPDKATDLNLLPGQSPVIDHITTLLDDQPMGEGGGSFKPYLKDTLQVVRSHRQPDSGFFPETRSIVFSSSSRSEVDSFVDSFNEKLHSLNSSKIGSLPINYFHMNVEYVYGKSNSSFTRTSLTNGEKSILPCTDEKMPARITLGFWTERWDIIFPWKVSQITSDHKGDYNLFVPRKIPDHWHSLFSRLHGYGLGIDLYLHLENLSSFIANAFTFANKPAMIELKTMDLNSLLALARVNMSEISVSSLGLLFTGGFYPSIDELERGYGKLSDLHGLPHHLNTYLQAKSMSVMNAAVLSNICVILHTFPTPGIACLVSKKVVEKFLLWHSRYLTSLLENMSLSTLVLTSQQQVCDKLTKISVKVENTYFDAEQISKCYPPWPAATHGGCPTDQLALTHIMQNVHPMICRSGVPPHLRWGSNAGILTGLFGCPSGKSRSDELLGCRLDQGIPEIPDLYSLYEDKQPSLIEAARSFKSSLPTDSPLSGYTLNQIMLLYTWLWPGEVGELYMLNFDSEKASDFRPFKHKQIEILGPIICAYLGMAFMCSEFYSNQRNLTFLRKDKERLKAALSEAKIKKDRSKVKKAQMLAKHYGKKYSVNSLSDSKSKVLDPILDAPYEYHHDNPCDLESISSASNLDLGEQYLDETDLESISSGELDIDLNEPYSPSQSILDMQADEQTGQGDICTDQVEENCVELVLHAPDLDAEELMISSHF